MKARPRAVERSVAKYLSDLMPHLTPIQRIPVLGRTGPDLTTNELGLVVDVKSRLSVPAAYFSQIEDERFRIIPLWNLPYATGECDAPFSSKVVGQWYDHMDEWRRRHRPTGFTALILHRPRMPYGEAVLILSKSDHRRFIDTWNKLQLHPSAPPLH
jgi:hypothetical protein